MSLTVNAMRRAFGAVAAVAAIAISGLAAAPAQAATYTPAFEIFYSPNCSAGGSASHVYSGPRSNGEAWINDTFNSTQFGSAGYGSRIRNNAASIYVSHAQVMIVPDHSVGSHTFVSAGACFNLEPWGLRNNNTDFFVYTYNG